jgi:4-hydroxyphenylacetate 3-monooxygenase
MLRTGTDYLEALRDDRAVYIGGERVAEVTSHPAFRNTARAFAEIYDRKRAPEHIALMSYEEDGERYSSWFLKPKSKDDLRKRAETHRRVAQWNHGLLGRSPDHVASVLTGLAMRADLLEGNRKGFGKNLLDYFDESRRKDLFSSYVVVAPQGARNPELYNRPGTRVPGLHVSGETDSGVILNGIKMLGTAAVFSDEIWVGNLLPLAPDQKEQAVTCAVPTNSRGVSMWVRKPYALYAAGAFDDPITSRFDESDAMVIFEDVAVPWNRVFLLNDVVLSREMYFQTPSHVMGNHQSVVRFNEKLKFMLGLAYKAAEINSVLQVPAVRETLASLAASEAGLRGMIAGQIEDAEALDSGFVQVNRRAMYAALFWCTNNYYQIAERVRELLGAGPFQMPADASFLAIPKMREAFEHYWAAPGAGAFDRLKFMKLAWDYLGSELAGRHGQYERFYAGPQFVHTFYNFNNCPWNEYKRAVDDVMSGMQTS